MLLRHSISISPWHRIELQFRINALIRVLEEDTLTNARAKSWGWVGGGAWFGTIFNNGVWNISRIGRLKELAVNEAFFCKSNKKPKTYICSEHVLKNCYRRGRRSQSVRKHPATLVTRCMNIWFWTLLTSCFFFSFLLKPQSQRIKENVLIIVQEVFLWKLVEYWGHCRTPAPSVFCAAMARSNPGNMSRWRSCEE